eukprot:14832090-Alexandrium_andersonii.AAC.1
MQTWHAVATSAGTFQAPRNRAKAAPYAAADCNEILCVRRRLGCKPCGLNPGSAGKEHPLTWGARKSTCGSWFI